MKTSRKIVAVLLAAVLCVAMASVCFAAPSTSNTIYVTDADGNEVEMTDATDANFYPLTSEIAGNLVPEIAGKNKVVLDGTHSNIDSSYAGQALTFHNIGTAGTKIYAYHWTGTEWEYVTSTTISSEGSATVTFPDLSPVGFAVPTSAGGDSPNTGVSSYTIPAAALIVLAGFGIAIVVKRERA